MTNQEKQDPPEKPGRPENARARIVAAALECFAENGYEGTSIAQIARRAGASPASIYLHFKNKQELFDSLNQAELNFPPPRAQERREAILKAALHVFDEKGYDGASMDDVARNAGISKAAIYGYFASKEQLLETLVNQTGLPVFSLIEAPLAEEPVQAEAEVERFLHQVAVEYLRMFRDPERVKFLRLILAEGGRKPDVAATFKKVAVERGAGLVANRLMALGVGSPDHLVQQVQAFIGMLFSWVLLHRLFSKTDIQEASAADLDKEEREAAERSVHLFLHGLLHFDRE